MWASIEQLADVVRGGSPRPAGDSRYFGGPVPWITVGPITADESDYLHRVPEGLTLEGKERSRYIEPQTLLLTNSGATLGVPKISLIGVCINDGVAALLDVDYPLKRYLLSFLRTKTISLRRINQGAAMPYSDHFKLADDFISHLDGAIGGIADPFIRSRYVGFIAVSAATVFELAVKDILCSFAAKKHKILGTFAGGYFERLNGQIGRDRIENKYLPLFGDKYVDRFRKRLEVAELACLRVDSVSIKSSYGNLLTWRHGFAHEGVIPANATYEEVKKSYLYGRKLIDCLSDAMQR